MNYTFFFLIKVNACFKCSGRRWVHGPLRLPALHGRLPASDLVPDSPRGPERRRAARCLPPHAQRKGQESSSSSSSARLPPVSFPLSVSLRMSKNHPVVFCVHSRRFTIFQVKRSVNRNVWWIYLTLPAFIHRHPLKSNVSVPVSPAGRHHDVHQRSRRGNTDGNYITRIIIEIKMKITRLFSSFIIYDCFIPSWCFYFPTALISFFSFTAFYSHLRLFFSSMSLPQLMFPGFLSENLQQWVQRDTQT